jgi:hypothetical protein
LKRVTRRQRADPSQSSDLTHSARPSQFARPCAGSAAIPWPAASIQGDVERRIAPVQVSDGNRRHAVSLFAVSLDEPALLWILGLAARGVDSADDVFDVGFFYGEVEYLCLAGDGR